ncbi:unnamed protein product [Rotaria sordida]|uniref:Uncharacterized protein n=1 Tax=Rotaria sordida TaxID=392033 RepID=A0A814CIF4_9BILA|nr:unnamed protein product [Rotaria sordida]
MVESQLQSIGIGVSLGIVGLIGYYIYDAYRQSVKPSKYMLATEKMGFIGYEKSNGQRVTMEQQQEALLRIFQLAGYFTLPNIWHDLNSIQCIKNLENVFQEISAVVKFSNADQPDPRQFNAKYMRKNLFKSNNMDLQDALDLILYIIQYAYTRQIGQERYELVSPDWIITYANEYRQAARLLRLIDREYPSLNEYDGAWIAGAARIDLVQRILDFNYQIMTRNIKIDGETLVLAGEREIWANIDGISPSIRKQLLKISQNNIDIDTISLLSSTIDDSTRINEGKSYMIHLAKSYNIKLNASQPFIQYQSKEECPLDRFPDRIYANYDVNETSKLTETLLSHDLLQTFSNNIANKICIIDTLAQEQIRPNTASTARDAAERLIKRIFIGDYGDKKTFFILLCTNNPYIERQTLTTQRHVNGVMEKYGLIEKDYQIKIEGFGCSCKQPLIIVHSELSALTAEKWKFAVNDIQKSLRLKGSHLGIREKDDIEEQFILRNDEKIIKIQVKFQSMPLLMYGNLKFVPLMRTIRFFNTAGRASRPIDDDDDGAIFTDEVNGYTLGYVRERSMLCNGQL